MAGFQLQFCRQTSPVNSFFLLVWIRTPHRLTTTAVFRALVMVPSPTVGSQECSGKERNTCLKRLSHSSFLDKHHLGRGRWFSTPCLLLKAKAVPLATGEFRTLQRRFRIHLSVHSQRRGKLWFPSPFQALALYLIIMLFWIVYMWIRNQISFLPLTWEWQSIV